MPKTRAASLLAPFPAGDIRYDDRRKVKDKIRQHGTFNKLLTYHRPVLAKLRVYEKMVRQDLTIQSAVNTRVDAIVGSIGMPVHPDPEIQEFHRNNLATLEDSSGKSWEQVLREIQFTKDWAGFCVSEVLYDLNFGALTLKDIVTYHPSTITIYPDKNGMLSEGNETYDGYHRSGIYQHTPIEPTGERQLKLWKHIYMAGDSEYGNYYGHSLVAPSYKWSRLKEVMVEMMLSAMDRLGSRALWVRSPSQSMTDDTVVDPNTGDQRPKTTLEFIQEQLEAADGDIRAIILPQTTPGSEFKPEVGSIPMSDNFGDTFLETLRYVDSESVRHIVPYFLIQDTNSLEAARERRMEVYFKTIINERKVLMNHLIQKALMTTQQWNFSKESAKIPPTFAHQYSDRPEDRVATMQVVTGLTSKGYLNPQNSMDWAMVRQIGGLSDREMEPDDLEFIKDILIKPLQPDAGNEAVKKTEAGRPTGTTTPQNKDREPPKDSDSGDKAKKNMKSGG
jgi:hypothetical protein